METVEHRILRGLNRLLEFILPGDFYVHVLRFAIPVFDPQRRGAQVAVYRDSGCYVAEAPTFKYFFNSPFNVGRYLYREQHHQIANVLISKYSSHSVTVSKGDVVVDIGANVGEFAMAVADKASLVLAVEPDPSPYRCLLRNVEAYHNVRCIRAAVGGENRETIMFMSPNHNDSSLLRPKKANVRSEKVLVMTLARLMKQECVSKIDFLKLEAEGYEPEILDSARPVLKLIRKIAVDGGPERHGQPTADTCTEILRAEGFVVSTNGFMVYAFNPALC